MNVRPTQISKSFWLMLVAVTVCATPLFAQNFIWTLTSAPANLTWDSVASSSDGDKLVAADGPDGIIITSTNSGRTWTQAGSAVASSIWQSIASSSDGTKLVTAAFGIFTSTNSGATWTQASSPQYWMLTWLHHHPMEPNWWKLVKAGFTPPPIQA